MIDWIQIDKDRINEQVDTYINKFKADTIEIPVYDFFVMMSALRDVIDEWGPSERVQKLTRPIYEKYMNIND